MTSTVLYALVSCTNASPARPTPIELIETAVVTEAPVDVPLVEVIEPVVLEETSVEVASVPTPPVESVGIEVRSGESLVLLADIAHSRAEDLADLNGLDVKAAIHPGQVLQVPVAVADQADFLARRDAWFTGKVSRYVAGRGGVVGLADQRVGTGDTAWSIARDQGGIPLWMVAFYNPDVDLDELGIGDHLTVPIFGDTVAEADAPVPTVE